MTFVVKCAPVLKEWNCCCCACSLRAASIILAWIITISHVTQFVTCVVYLSHPLIYFGYHHLEVLISYMSCVIGSIILEALLLYGIHKKKPMFMLPFLVMDLIGLIVVAGAILLFTVIIIPSNWQLGLVILLVGSGILALATFIWVVHYSYYRQVDEEKNSTTGIVNYTYGIPSGHVQISTCPEDEKALCAYPSKVSTETA